MNETEVNYTTINHIARRKFGLTWVEYGLADLIHRLSNNPQASDRWCYAKKKTLAYLVGTSEQYVYIMIDKLEQKGLVERHPDTKFLRTTQLWFDNVEITKSTKQSLVGLNKVYKQSLVTPIIDRELNNKMAAHAAGGSSKPTVKAFPRADYDLVLKEYQRLKGIKLEGKEYDQPSHEIKDMFLSNRTPQQIIDCMEFFAEWCNEPGYEWMRFWKMSTVMKKMPEFLAGKLKQRTLLDDYPVYE